MSYKKKPGVVDTDNIDPSVYYYDEIYDHMKNDSLLKEGDSNVGSSSEEKPTGSKYIDGIKQNAERRKNENELRRFKKFARDRAEFCQDEDVYITSSYSQKLSEMKRMEDAKRRQIKLEEDSLAMNFFKKPKNDCDVVGKSTNDKSQDKKVDVTDETKKKNTIMGVDSVAIGPAKPQKTMTKTNSQIEKSSKKLVTYDDKKRYLRKVLAKRTIGEVYLDAVRRYKERKETG